ncbi:DUF979 domain-containing protein [Mycoavidus sp. B2-EB]|uniref:DUF979 domain-containing protein n=1 Tax=Mycoavidus sp. B2-EB TaxID=2651972 RepID=UPI00162564C8|nr:DUF979 domain-containing protein [Mycoavidus sp. B2-EB]BBO58971.1 hypothetical protein MPB2EB_0066 [Mycoavidus sp. B2-EB]
MTLSINYLYWLVGAILAVIALMIVSDRTHPKRLQAGSFWAIYACIFLIGERLPAELVGILVIIMALLAGFGGVVAGPARAGLSENARHQSVQRLGNKLFIPALTIPAVTVIGTLLAPYLVFNTLPLFDPKNITLLSFGLGCIVAAGLSCWLTRDNVGQSIHEARRLTESLSWAVVLPQLLGTLGLVFSEAGVGKAVSFLSTAYINMDLRLTAVIVYCVGMALFTMVMGNAFAAFPVMAGGVGVPILVGMHHADPAIMAALGMFSGYCGTLLTPMAANFNMVPAALLELPDKNGVIKAQAPTAFVLLAVNIILMYVLVFR